MYIEKPLIRHKTPLKTHYKAYPMTKTVTSQKQCLELDKGSFYFRKYKR
jgi:hypothetical protein